MSLMNNNPFLQKGKVLSYYIVPFDYFKTKPNQFLEFESMSSTPIQDIPERAEKKKGKKKRKNRRKKNDVGQTTWTSSYGISGFKNSSRVINGSDDEELKCGQQYKEPSTNTVRTGPPSPTRPRSPQISSWNADVSVKSFDIEGTATPTSKRTKAPVTQKPTYIVTKGDKVIYNPPSCRTVAPTKRHSTAPSFSMKPSATPTQATPVPTKGPTSSPTASPNVSSTASPAAAVSSRRNHKNVLL